MAALSSCVAAASTKRKPSTAFKSSDLVHHQEKGRVYSQVIQNKKNEPVSVVVSLSRQRAYLFVGNQLAADSPISSGRRPGMTLTGKFVITQKDIDHRSSIYGNFVDSGGNIIKEGVNRKVDSAPSGTHYVGASMFYFMRLNQTAIGMHVGYLPGYAASHGCIRMPSDMAKIFYETVPSGAPVRVES